MSEFDFEEMIAGAVDDYRTSTLHSIRPAGVEAAHKTARRRKRVHMATLAALIAIFVAVPVSAYAVTDHDHNGPPTTAATNGSTTPPPAPSTSATQAAPSSTPSAPPSTAKTSTPSSYGAFALANAKLTIPSWGPQDAVCAHGTVQLHNSMFVKGKGSGDTPQTYGIAKVITADVNHDGSTDVVALLSCERSDPGLQQVAAYRRTAGGSIQLLGQVVGESTSMLDSTINGIDDIAVGGNGTIRVHVSDVTGSAGLGVTRQVRQWRTYGWNGHGFGQTGGSRSFSVSDGLTATVSDATFTGTSGSNRTGTMTVTLHNGSGHTISGVSVYYAGDDGGEPELANTAACGAPNDNGVWACTVGSIAAGHSATLTLHLMLPNSEVSGFEQHPSLKGTDVMVQIRVGDQMLASQPALGKAVFS
jgi:hypothetical protein